METTSNQTVTFTVYHNNVASTLVSTITQDWTSNTNVVSTSFGGLLSLATSDYLEVFVSNDNGSNENITCTVLSMSVVCIGN